MAFCLRARHACRAPRLPRILAIARTIAAWLSFAAPLVANSAYALPSDGSTLASDRGAVGSAAVEGSVEPDLASGAATWSLPIDVPPGAGGLTPELALRYSSAARNDSWVGYGWALGLSSITRSLRRGVPAFDDARDIFELDGEELVPDLASPDRYHTRRERFLRIEHEADGSWTVRRKDGTWLRLGTRPDARIDDGHGRPFEWLTSELHDPLGNAIAAHYDRRDDGIAYLAEVRWTLRRDAAGVLHSLGDDPGRDRVLRFVLEPRPDRATSYAAGFRRLLAHRVARIDVIAAGALLRRFTLSWAESADSKRSLLVALAHYGSDADAPQPTPPRVTRFDYTANRVDLPNGQTGPAAFVRDGVREASWPASFSFVRSDQSDGGVRLADVDGDGRPDLVKAFSLNPATGADAVRTADSGVHLATSTGFEPTPSARFPLPVFDGVTGNRIPLSFAFEFPNGVVWGNGTTLMDLTGDGRADVLGAIGFAAGTHPGWSGPLAQSLQSEWCLNTGTGFSCRLPAPAELDGASFTGKQGATFNFARFGYEFTLLAGNVQFADVDGDGLPDLVVRGRDRFIDGSGSCLHESLTSFISHNDGALGFTSDALEPIAPSVSTCTATTQRIGTRHQPCAVTDPLCAPRLFHNDTQLYADAFGSGLWLFAGQQERGRLELDLNADGLSDIVGAANVFGVFAPFTALGDGRGGYIDSAAFTLPEPLVEVTAPGPLDPFSDGRSRDLGVRFADLNGDGRLDVIRARADDPAGPALWWNRGESAPGQSVFERDDAAFSVLPPGLGFVDAQGRDLGWRIVDVDGDGVDDFVRSYAGAVEIWRQVGEPPDLLRDVTLPAGGRIRLSYTPATRFDHRDDDGVPGLASSMPLLTALEADDATGQSAGRTTLEYTGGVFDPVRRELRGFAQVEVTDPLGHRATTSFHVDETQARLPESVLRTDATGLALEEMRFEYTSDVDGVAPFVALPSATTRLEWDGEAVARRSRVETIYDGGGPITLGNVTERIEFGEVDSAGVDVDPADTRTEQRLYAPEHAALHLAGLVTVEHVWRGRSGSGVLARESRRFYDGDTTGVAVPTRGLVTRRVEVLDEPGRVDPTVRFDHDAFGNVVSVHDPRAEAGEGGGITHFEIDPVFATFRTATINPLGHRSELSLDADPTCPLALPAGFGLPQIERGPNDLAAGSAHVRCFDAFGRVVRDVPPGGRGRERMLYDDTPGASSVTRFRVAGEGGGERSEERILDGFGRERAILATAAGGRLTLVERGYDAAGRVAYESAPHDPLDPARLTVFLYDGLGRRIETRLPGVGRTWRSSVVHGVVTETDPVGRVTERAFDPMGRLVHVDEHIANAVHRTTYEWSALDLLEHITDADGHVTTLVYDRLGRRRLLIDPAFGAEAAVFDAAGNVIERWSGAGIASWRYDALDRPIERRLGAVVDATWTWDTALRGVGRLAQRTDGAGLYRVDAYDDAGRATRETHERAGDALVFETDFDPLGQPRERRYPGGAQLVWSHDPAGFLSQIALDGETLASAIEWDASGRLAHWRAGNGVTWHAGFDPSTARLDDIIVRDAAGAALADLRWRFDEADRVDDVEDRLDATRSRNYQHDELDRLVRASGPYGPGGALRTLHYAYDALGNLLCLDGDDPVTCGGGRRFDIDPGSGRLLREVDGVAVTHGANGRIESIGSRRFSYDGLDRLLRVSDAGRTLASFAVDATGRVARSVESAGGRSHVRERVASDFEWDRARALATLRIGLGGATIASAVVPFDGRTAARAGIPARSRSSHGATARRTDTTASRVAAGGAIVGAWLVAATLAHALAGPRVERRRRVRAGLSAWTAVAFFGAHTAQTLPDGDLTGDGTFDAADVLRAWQIARHERPATPGEMERGNVAPVTTGTVGGFGTAGSATVRSGATGSGTAGSGAAGSGSTSTGAQSAIIDDGDVAVLLRGLRDEDVDADGLSGADERALGTNPFTADSDGDGLSDATERALRTDPLDPDSDGDGFADRVDPQPRRGITWQHADALGSPLLVTRADGATLARPVHRPFGAPVSPAGGVSGYGFTGLRFEAAAGLFEAGARRYDPLLARFLQADVQAPDPSHPQRLGRHTWVDNDPVRLVDPDGHFPRLGLLLGAAVGAFVAGTGGSDRQHQVQFLGAVLNVGFGRGSIGFALDGDGSLRANLGLLAGIPLVEAVQRASTALRSPLRSVAFASLRFGDVLITRDGGSAEYIARIPGMGGYGHSAFVVDAPPEFGVASSDNRGRYYASNDDASVGGRSFDVFRTGEVLDPTIVRLHLDDLRRTDGLGGGLRQYLGNGGDNICSEFVATLYRDAGGRRLDGMSDMFVTPGDLAARLGPPIGQVFVPRAARSGDGGGR